MINLQFTLSTFLLPYVLKLSEWHLLAWKKNGSRISGLPQSFVDWIPDMSRDYLSSHIDENLYFQLFSYTHISS